MSAVVSVASVLFITLAFGSIAAHAGDNDPSNSIGMKFVAVKAGEFMMGEGELPPRARSEWALRDWDEGPAHRVKFTRDFFMGVHEVTNAQYEQFQPKHKALRGLHGASKLDDEPVTFVTWQQANDFCGWLSKKEGKPYRLPTEAEWEFACRAGTTTKFFTGDTLLATAANLDKVGPVSVGKYPANPWGLYDMHGNVAEWCLDWYGPYEPGEQTDPVGRADGDAKVCRGWSFLKTNLVDNARYARSASRSGHLPDDANRCTGFRVVIGEMPATKPLPLIVQPYQQNVRKGKAPKPPDAEKPFFVDYAKQGAGPTIPKDSWGPVFSTHNHFAAICVCPNGDVLAACYTTVREPGRECSLAISRLRRARKSGMLFAPSSLFPMSIAMPRCYFAMASASIISSRSHCMAGMMPPIARALRTTTA